MDNIEDLAAVQHDIWSHWMNYQFSCCIKNEDGSLTIPADKVKRWSKQMETSYEDLTDKEKQSDRNQVLKFVHLI